MGMDFNVNVDVKTTGKEQIDALERQLNALKSETVKINVDIDSKNLIGKNFSTKNFSKQLQDSIDKSVKSVKFKSSDNFYDQYFKEAKKSKKEAEKVEKDFAKSIEETNTADVDKAAFKAAKAKIAYDKKIEQIREKQAIKQAEQSAKIIENARNKVLNGTYDAQSSVMKNRLDTYEGSDSTLVKKAQQEAELYNGTLSKLREHFDVSNSFALNDDEIKRFLSKNHLDELILKLPKGFDTIITENGSNLSGGQKQYISILRAIIKQDSKILIFDEATASLDTNVEYQLIKALKPLIKNKTFIHITHKKYNDYMERFLCLQNGSITELKEV